MHDCGYRTGQWQDDARPNWDGDGPRPLAWAAWYPVDAQRDGKRAPMPAQGIFDSGEVYLDLPCADGGPWPVVLLSHGTGGSAESLGWLARTLACRGVVVLAAQHHGNTSLEPYRAEGFLCWWERARDLSCLLTLAASEGPFKEALDLSRVTAIGYSLGAHTALSLGGAITSMDLMLQWQQHAGDQAGGPREFPDLADHIPSLLADSAFFRASWARQGDAFRDARVRAIVAIAPPPPVRAFTPSSVRGIAVPVTILAGGADAEAPFAVGAQWLGEMHPGFVVHNLGDRVGHQAFLSGPSAIGRHAVSELFSGVDDALRREVHRQSIDIVVPVVCGGKEQARA